MHSTPSVTFVSVLISPTDPLTRAISLDDNSRKFLVDILNISLSGVTDMVDVTSFRQQIQLGNQTLHSQALNYSPHANSVDIPIRKTKRHVSLRRACPRNRTS